MSTNMYYIRYSSKRAIVHHHCSELPVALIDKAIAKGNEVVISQSINLMPDNLQEVTKTLNILEII